MKSDNAKGWLALLLAGSLPWLFWRGVAESFDLVKATILWLTGLAFLVILLIDNHQNRRFFTKAHWYLITLGVAVALTTATSHFPATSLYGQYARYVGLFSYFSYIIVGIAVSTLPRSWKARVKGAVLFSGTVSSIYVLIQHLGADPFQWTTASFGNPTFGPLGNPNTTSAFVAVSCALALVVLESSGTIGLRILAYSTLGLGSICVSLLNSFQGNAVLFLCFLYAFLRLLRRCDNVLDVLQIFLASFGLFVIIPSGVTEIFWSSILAMICVAALVNTKLPMTLVQTSTLRTSVVVFQAAVLGASLAASIFVEGARTFLVAGFKDGFVERGDFYRAAVVAFQEFPITGTGLDTFGYFFSRFRPESHAVNLESSRTSSAHNVYLEAFSNGGIVLGIAFAIFVLSPLISWMRAKREATSAFEGDTNMLLPYVSICLIFVVSVEHVVLNLVVFVFWGLMMSASKEKISRRESRSGVGAPLRWSVSVVGALLFVVGTWVAIRPFAAALKARDASEAIDAPTRVKDLEEATRWMRSEPAYWLALGDQQLALGDYESASNSLWKSMEKSAFSGAVAPQVARVFAQIGDIERSLATIEESALNDPYAPQMRSELSQLLLEIEEALRANSITVLDGRIVEIRQSTGL